MTDKTIESRYTIGGDYFALTFIKKSKYKLDYYLNQFNFDDYYCIKSSGIQRLVTYQQLIEFKHCQYLFLRKSKYNIDYINLWLSWLSGMIGIQFLNIPFPPFNPNKIIIK